jgi:hypothetical protein
VHGEVQAGQAVARGIDQMALSGQVIDQVGGEVGIVLDDQDFQGAFMARLWSVVARVGAGDTAMDNLRVTN